MHATSNNESVATLNPMGIKLYLMLVKTLWRQMFAVVVETFPSKDPTS